MSSLINHTYEDVAGQVTLTESSNDILNVNVSVNNLVATDHTEGGTWKLVETFDTNLVSPFGGIVSTKSDTSTIVFNKYVSVGGYTLANLIRPGMSDTMKNKYTQLFGGTGDQTVFKIWYNESCPIVNIICFDPNGIDQTKVITEADRTDCKQSVCIGLYGYPVAAFKTTDVGVASRSFTQANITDRSREKLTNLNTATNLQFTGTWKDEYFETVAAADWVKAVQEWTESHNRGLISEERKNKPDFNQNAVNKYDFGSLTYKMISKQIDNLENLFFTVS